MSSDFIITASYVQVSTYAPSTQELSARTDITGEMLVTNVFGGETEPQVIKSNNITPIQIYEDYYVLGIIDGDSESHFCYVCTKAGAKVDNVTLPSEGIYFLKMVINEELTLFCNTYLTIPGYNNFTTTSTQEVIKTEHLPEALRFGEVQKTISSDVLTWDGNTDGLDNIKNVYFRVSDATPTAEDLYRGFSVKLSAPDGSILEEITVSAEEAQNSVDVQDNGIIVHNTFYIFPSSITLEGETFAPGIYFLVVYGAGFISHLQINGYSFVTTTTELVKLDPKYLPSGIGGGGGLPDVTSADNGKSVSVVNGEWVVKKNSYNDLADKPIIGGTFAGQIVAHASYQDPSTSLLRNSKIVKTETTPSYNGEICWICE